MLIRGINPHEVDDTTLAEMVSLLDTKEDSVRAWAAGSLGNLGRRAKVAVSKLLKLLPEVDCLRGSLTSSPAIRVALKRMGQTPPPLPDCKARKEQK
jgi:HEAT repeat protein